MKSTRLSLLTSPLFILALGLLLLNDFYLKYEYTSWATGKLSDFAGLFLFPFFISTFFLRSKNSIYIATGLIFIFWKSEYAQGLINWAQSVGLSTDRVIDYTDLISLIVLPFSLRYFNSQLTKELPTKRTLALPIMFLSLFAIVATSRPRDVIQKNVEIGKVYTIDSSKEKILEKAKSAYNPRQTRQTYLKDSLFVIHYDMTSDYSARLIASVNITPIDSTSSQIRLDSVLYMIDMNQEALGYFESLTASDFSQYFEEHIIPSLTGKKDDSNDIILLSISGNNE